MPYGQGGGNCILVQKNIGIIQAGLNSEPQRGESWFSPVFIITGRMHMGNRITKESMEFIAGEIMDAVHTSNSLEDGINKIQEILESNGIVEIIPD